MGPIKSALGQSTTQLHLELPQKGQFGDLIGNEIPDKITKADSKSTFGYLSKSNATTEIDES